MIGVHQTRFYCKPDGAEPPGNCFAACLASILEVGLDEVPDELDFWKPGIPSRVSWPSYWDRVIEWLSERRLSLIEFDLTNDCPLVTNIMSGHSPRNPKSDHSVVARGEEGIWDPHPDNTWILPGKHTHMFLVKD